MKRSKKYLEALKKVDQTKKYTPTEAMEAIKEISFSKFPGSVEIEMKLGLNEKQSKESVRGSYTLSNAFGKTTKVLVFADPGNLSKAKSADTAGGEELIEQVEKGTVEYDVVLATPAMMPKIARLGKTLGTKGLMPNPKNGTITEDLEKAIASFKSGMRNFKVKENKITAVIGKTDMKTEELVQNYSDFVNAVTSELKKFGTNMIKVIKLSPSMGPSIELDNQI